MLGNSSGRLQVVVVTEKNQTTTFDPRRLNSNFKDKFAAKVARSEQVCQQIEALFEYVGDCNGNKIFTCKV